MSRYLRIWGALDAREPDWRRAVPLRLNYVDPSDLPEEGVVYVAYDVPPEAAPRNIFRPDPRGRGWIVPYARSRVVNRALVDFESQNRLDGARSGAFGIRIEK